MGDNGNDAGENQNQPDAGHPDTGEPDTGEPDASQPDPGEPIELGEQPVPGVDPTWVGGHSVENRPVIVEHYGESGPVMYFTDGIHGQERLANTYSERFRTRLNAGYAEEMGIQVVAMLTTNPDGMAYYDRYNINGVDLNRNFPTNNYEPGGVAGPEALSEPEAAAMQNVIDASNLSSALSLHCCAPTFDPDGPAEELAEAMSQAMDPEYRFPAHPLGAASGSMGSYVGLDMGLPIITVEFAGSLHMDPLIQLAQMDLAVDAAGLWTEENGQDTNVDFGAMNAEDGWSLRSWYAGTSAGDLPLRVESTGGPDAEQFVLLSGFDGSNLRGPWIAEHIRRELLAVPDLNMPLWRMITAVNPDGLRSGSPTNDAAIDILDALAQGLESGESSHEEVAAVLDVLSDGPATVFLVLSQEANADRVGVAGPAGEELENAIGPRFEVGLDGGNPELVDALVDAGHSVVQIVVGTENAESQLEPGNWTDFDGTLNSPFDFSSMVFSMTQ